MARVLPFAAAGLLAIALAACGVSHSSGDFVPGVAADAAHARGVVKLTITLPAIQRTNVPIDWASNPKKLSAATRSVSGSIGARSFGPIGLSTSRDGCEATSDGLACSFSIIAPVGKHQAEHIRTYASANGTGPVLASANLMLDVTGGKDRFTAPPMVAIAHRLVAAPLYSAVHRGTWQPVPIAVYGVDAAGAPIPSRELVGRNGAPITSIAGITVAGFVNETIRGADGGTLACCGGIAGSFAYDGLRLGHETFMVKAPGFTSQPVTLNASAGPNAPATLVTGSSYSNSPTYVNFIAQYGINASGNAPPVRSFVPPGGSNRPFGEDQRGTFWVEGTHFNNDGSIIGRVAIPAHTMALARDVSGNLYAATSCSIVEYPAGHYGKPAAIRQIRFARCDSVSDLSVDGNGNIFVALEDRDNTPARILEYAPAGGASDAPVHAITFASGHNVTNLDTDARGNLYALDVAGARARLLEFAPGTRTGKPLLSGISIQTFAVNDDGGVYARVYSEPGPGSLQYFAPSANSPSQIISGEATQLYDVGPITVPRI